MAKILCAKSGIQFQCEHFPIHFTQNEVSHPIFSASLKQLWKFYPKWQTGELTDIDSYLLFLSLLNSTDLVEFRTAAIRHETTDAIIAQNMESLYRVLGHIVAIRNPRFVLPRFVISHDTRTLTNVKHWIEIWSDQYNSFVCGMKDQDLRSKLQKREAALERFIKNPAIKPEKYAHLLAQWAAIAAEFPASETTLSNGTTTTISDYWQDLIIKCYNSIDIIQIERKDLIELIEHCEEWIELGSIFSYHLFNTLREGLQTIDGFFSAGSQTTFAILGDGESVEASNLQLLINSAPTDAPKRTEYPTEFAFLKAKMKWNLAVATAATPSSNSTNSIDI